MTAILVCLVAIGQAPENTKSKGFAVTCPWKIVWLQSIASQATNRANPRTKPKVPCEPGTFANAFQITHDGEPPSQGVFTVGTKVHEPSVKLIKGNKRWAVVRNVGNQFQLTLGAPGTYGFRVSVAEWSKEVEIECRQVPFHDGVSAKTIIEKYGPPDAKKDASWAYQRWPVLEIMISGDPGIIQWMQTLPDSNMGKKRSAEVG